MPDSWTLTGFCKLLRDETGCELLPADLSSLFYRKRVPDVPIFGGRRVIRKQDLPALMSALRRLGKIPADAYLASIA